jgi:hypothetical protein
MVNSTVNLHKETTYQILSQIPKSPFVGIWSFLLRNILQLEIYSLSSVIQVLFPESSWRSLLIFVPCDQ